jgi:hypothetical protein
LRVVHQPFQNIVGAGSQSIVNFQNPVGFQNCLA